MTTFYAFLVQLLLISFLLREDKNNGGPGLFRKQIWGPLHALVLVSSINAITIIGNYLLRYAVARYLVHMSPYVFHLLYSIPLIILLRYQIRQGIAVFGFRANWTHICMAMMIVLAWHSVLSSILYFVKGPAALDPVILRPLRQLSTIHYALYLFAFVIFAPVIEEMIFRGFLYSPYRKKYGPLWAIILNTLLFALNHSMGTLGTTFSYGLIYGGLYEKTESIVPPIIAHSSVNLLIILTPSVIKLLN